MRKRRVKRIEPHDRAWHDAQMAKGQHNPATDTYNPWWCVNDESIERMETSLMANSPTDVFQYIKMQGSDDCWPWTGAWGGRPEDRRPYFQAQGKRRVAYRWVDELVNGPLPDNTQILHSCDLGGYPVGCCNPNHWRRGTHDENMKDMTDRQRHGLPHMVVRAIRRLLEKGEDTQQQIADRYGLTREAVSAIATGRSYKHLE